MTHQDSECLPTVHKFFRDIKFRHSVIEAASYHVVAVILKIVKKVICNDSFLKGIFQYLRHGEHLVNGRIPGSKATLIRSNHLFDGGL